MVCVRVDWNRTSEETRGLAHFHKWNWAEWRRAVTRNPEENAMQCQHIKRRTRAPRRHPYLGRGLPFDVVSEAAYCCVRLVPVGSAAPLRRSYDVAFHQVTGKPYCTPRGRSTYGPQRRASQRHRFTPSGVTWVWTWSPALQRIQSARQSCPVGRPVYVANSSSLAGIVVGSSRIDVA
jgi:hypothetical protein